MLIDDFLPRYDVTEYHELLIPASAAATYDAIWRTDLTAAWPVKVLFALRALPSLLAEPIAPRSPFAPVTLRDVTSAGFCLLGEVPGREVVLGVSGSFWQPTGNITPTDAARFRDPPPAGTARGAWNFIVSERTADECLLSTETRVLCADDGSRYSFRRYWLFVGPFSGLIRRFMLREISAVATERARAPAR